MYQDLFDVDKQAAMRKYFLTELAAAGVIKSFHRRQLVDEPLQHPGMGIVLRGKVVKSIVSSGGQEKMLYILRPGEIFGEMAFFAGGFLNYLVRVKEDTEISFISRDLLQETLAGRPDVHSCLINSITRKYRIILLQLTNNTFNDSIGRVADALLRLAACADPLEVGEHNNIISTVFTQNELAHNVGCSRITVSRILQRLRRENLISIRNKRIVIEDLEGLAGYTDRVQ
ncbi:MAG TPA: Crp/Fnr family transcriptional regulator [Patescibacteria group bacterium]|nr:Crp/Fnr family transcriptional regulator [Patescibacteria group bacterium]